MSSQREDKHYYITSLFNPPVTLPLSLSLHLTFSLSVTHPPLLHILYPPIPLVAAKALTDKLQGRQREKEMAREREKEVERGSDIQKEKDPGTRVHCFRSLPCFLFSLSLTPLPFTSSLLPPSALLFSLRRSRQIKIQLTDV